MIPEREICLTIQTLEMPWFVNTPVLPELLEEKKGDRDEGLCKVLGYRDGRKWNFPFFFFFFCFLKTGFLCVDQAGLEITSNER